jgi:hypothetical protein
MRTCLGIVMSMCLFLVGAAPVQAAPLTGETLTTMLENLGYTVEEGGTKDAKTFKFKETLADNSLTFTITMDFSSDKTMLWMYTGLYSVPEGKTAPGSALLALLAKNDDIGPEFFSYSESNKLFYLNYPAPNTDVTPAILRQRLKAFLANLGATRDLWDPEKWGH